MEPSDQELAALVAAYAATRPGWNHADVAAGDVRLVHVEHLRRGDPGLLDVVAELGDRLVHVVLGLRRPHDEPRWLPEADDAAPGVLGTLGDLVAFDAMRDIDTAALLLEVVAGQSAEARLVRLLHLDQQAVTLAMEERLAFTVFNELAPGPRPSTEVVMALDEVGFNHLAAPVAAWRSGSWDLGFIQEHLAAASTGWALALTSVRDLYASGGPPELAGGDFGAEAHRLGTMTARLHLAMERAFGRRQAKVSSWADAVEQEVQARAPRRLGRPEVQALLAELRVLPSAAESIRTHGDYHLGRVWRAEQGWYVGDFSAGEDTAADAPFRSPLADVADMMWSFGHVAASAAAERDPTGRDGLRELAEAWEQRNRRAFLAGYMGVAGIAGLVPPGRDAVRVLVGAFELERSSRATP